MNYLPHIIGALFITAGLFFMLVAAIGFLRLPDLFSRLHVTGILDTLGAPLVLIGVAVWVGPLTLTAGKLILALAFLFITSPLAGHLLSRAAIESGYRPQVAEDQTTEDDLKLPPLDPPTQPQNTGNDGEAQT